MGGECWSKGDQSGCTASLRVLGSGKCGLQDNACKWCRDADVLLRSPLERAHYIIRSTRQASNSFSNVSFPQRRIP
jgi:hypothetical protein